MEDKELDLSKVNEIDMECNTLDDDDFGGFGNTEITSNNTEVADPISASDDDRDLQTHTGIILDFGDDTDLEINPKELETVSKPITAQMSDKGIDVNMPVQSDMDFSGINEIDMECSIGEDDDFGPAIKHTGDFDDFEEDNLDRELVNEEIVAESKKKADAQINQGKVENDYYEKLKKKHAATNKKGAYNSHFHFSYDPKQEMDDFNHDMTTNTPVPNAITAPSVGAGDTNMTVAAQGMGMCENYRKLFEDLLVITGFELGDCKDGKCCFKDKYSNCEDKICSNIDDVSNFLNPYVEDCFIIPLQIETGNNFKTCKEWSDWYTPEMEKQYPQCKQDISYCDLCANHLSDCKLF